MLITIPHKYDTLTIWPERHLIFIIPLILIVISEFIILLQKQLTSTKILSVILGLFFLLSTGTAYIHSDIYEKAQNIKITADEMAPKIVAEVNEYRSTTNYNGTVLISYSATTFNSQWFSYRLIPYILMTNKELIANRIAIQNEWDVSDNHLPVKLNLDYLTAIGAPTLIWDQTTYPEITLSPT